MRKRYVIFALFIVMINYSSLEAQNWLLTGNALSGTEYVGSNNAYPLIFKTNNTERARILYNGNFGIGTNNPLGYFSVGTSSQFQVSAAGNVIAAGVNTTGVITS
jgi:hypothetical protein